MQSKQLRIAFLLFAFLFSFSLQAQIAVVNGTVQDAATGAPLVGASLRLDGMGKQYSTTTDANGAYTFDQVPYGVYLLECITEQYAPLKQPLEINQEKVLLPAFRLKLDEETDLLTNEDLIPTISVPDNDNDVSVAGSGQNVSGLLTASRDVFVSTASFVFGPLRFRMRGYDNDNTTVYLNGIPMNELETGRPIWSAWGGLNDVMRNREIGVGVQNLNFTFGGIGGATSIDTRASGQRRGTRISYANSNRSYNHRIMASHTTGMMSNGWAVAASVSWRYAGEAYIPGTSYNALSYFLSVDKKLSEKHLLSLTVFGTPTVRGGSDAAQTELYDLSGTNYYNSMWGYQTQADGKLVKRNARMYNQHQPMAILSHDWKINQKSHLQTSVAFQFGRYGQTALDWYNASDPRPDYYRKLPSYYTNTDPAAAEAIAEQFRNDVNTRQINWDQLYRVNLGNTQTIVNANGSGQNLTGRRAAYILEERRNDIKEFNFNSIYENRLNENFILNGGLTYQYYLSRNYKVVDDLLGADFYLDIDRFAERDSGVGSDFAQNNVDRPNATIKEGEVFGYDYNLHISKGSAWVQGAWNYNHWDAFVGAEVSNTIYWREGNLQNGKFENSVGKSPVQNFLNYAGKAGLTYKLDGRNYFYASGAYLTRAPYFRNAYVSARTRDQVVDGLQNEQIYSVEGGYLLKAPNLKARLVGFYTRFNNQTTVRSFFLDNAFQGQDGTIQAGFVNYIMTGIDKEHTGIEAAAELKLKKGFSIRGVASIGQYLYASRPSVTILLDNAPDATVTKRTAYLKNFRVGGTPQSAFNLGLNYNSPKFWFVNLNINYFMNNWVEVNPDRRTLEGVSYVNNPTYVQETIDQGSNLWEQVVGQERLKPGMTIDIFAGKSWRIKGKGRNYFLNLNLGLNNILNNREIVSTGFEQLRFDYETKDINKFPTQYFYNFGFNYFASLTFRW